LAKKQKIRLDHWIAAILMLAMAGIAFVNILSRYFINFSIGSTEEITINLFVWMTVVGTGIAFERSAQLGMVTFFNMFPLKARKSLVVFSAVLGAGLFVLVCIYMIQAIYDEMTLFHATSAALGIPVWIYYAGVPVLSVFVFRGIWRGAAARIADLEAERT
jgi:TRAP-type C4-dicarboxylate transport system permease small subunit